MTGVTDAAGSLVAATVIELGPCTVTQIKSAATDGYDAVQVTFGRKKLSRVTKAERGTSPRAKSPPVSRPENSPRPPTASSSSDRR